MPQFHAEHVPSSGLDAFTRDYLEAIEWLLDDEIDRDMIEGFAPSAIALAIEDCREFQKANETDLEAYQEATGHDGGLDLWLTRNGHGAGFWDHGIGALGDRLNSAARIGSCDAYLGDDNLIYLA